MLDFKNQLTQLNRFNQHINESRRKHMHRPLSEIDNDVIGMLESTLETIEKRIERSNIWYTDQLKNKTMTDEQAKEFLIALNKLKSSKFFFKNYLRGDLDIHIQSLNNRKWSDAVVIMLISLGMIAIISLVAKLWN